MKAGYDTTILIHAEELETANEVRAISLDKRNCRFSDEIPANLTIFKHYTQAICKFECNLRKARAICQCTPWSFPFDPSEDIRICDFYGFYCFDQVKLQGKKSIDFTCY